VGTWKDGGDNPCILHLDTEGKWLVRYELGCPILTNGWMEVWGVL
jgi:hypothetical protein